MSRELKFRAWDSRIGEFHYWDAKTQSNKNVFWKICRDENLSIDQYTGLKEKSGVDIYEGDILEHITDKNITIKKVVYDAKNGAFILICNKYFQELKATYCAAFLYADVYKIIGNIYENPKLYENNT